MKNENILNFLLNRATIIMNIYISKGLKMLSLIYLLLGPNYNFLRHISFSSNKLQFCLISLKLTFLCDQTVISMISRLHFSA